MANQILLKKNNVPKYQGAYFINPNVTKQNIPLYALVSARRNNELGVYIGELYYTIQKIFELYPNALWSDEITWVEE